MITVGIGTRVLNFLVDTLIIFLISYLLHKGWAFYAFYYKIIYFPFYYFFWFILVIYYIFFESIFNRTPGKWITLTKVINKKGGRPSFLQVLIRSFIRVTIIDCFFIPFINKTLHDYVSKTEVIEI
jgi:uncharacterized RDD family membrane protein YckC